MDLDTPPEAPFERLPAEILDLIIWQPSLCGEDIKSIRLVSRRITSSATRCLFQQVHISALHRDREVFLSIAQSPHLACHVSTLVWDELTGNFELLQDESVRIGMGWGDPFDSAGFNLVDDLTSQVEPLFWLTSKSVKLKEGKKKATDALPFWDEFVEAVDKFPALRSFVSRPMQPDREVQSAADGYPLTVRVINGFLHFNDWVENTDEMGHQDTVFNLGFLFYLIPLLKLYTERGDQRPRQLCFSDEAVVAMSSLEHLATSDAPAFRHLYHLELDVFEQAIRPSRETSGLEACLTEAVNLRHLHLKYIQAPKYKGLGPPPEADVYRSPLFAIPTLPSLLSLCLDSVILELSSSKSPDSVPDLPLDHEQPAFINFVKRHAATLKRLCVVSSAVTAHSMRKLARIPNLKLHRFIMIGPSGDNKDCVVEEEDILNFINSKHDDNLDGNNLSQQAEGPPALSFWSPLSTHEHPTWKEFRRDGWLSMDDDCREICRTYDASSGLWVDEDGIYYDPATDQEMTEPRPEYYRPKGWQVQVDKRRWDGDLGLWRDTSSCPSTPFHKFAIDKLADTTFGDNLDKRGENDPGLQEERDRAIELPAYPPELCLLEEFEHQARKLGRTKWAWGTDREGDVWYWEVLDDSPGHPTQTWHFTHRNGEEAYGDDPLNFWPDWEGGTSGDTVTATPFGVKLRSFAETARDKRPFDYWLGDSQPLCSQIGKKYGQPTRYSLLSDPWWAQR